MLQNKKGQLTLFIIIAIVIVALAILLYLFYPDIKAKLGLGADTPKDFLQNCMEDEIQDITEIVSLAGGSLEPENYIIYNGQRLEYLCYAWEYYQLCVMQRPLLKQHVEDQIESQIESTAEKCYSDLLDSYRKRGYSVNSEQGVLNLKLLPEKIELDYNRDLVISKNDEVFSYDGDNYISVIVNNNIYELLMIASNILRWEATYGDAETTTYMTYYPYIKVEKYKQSDGSTIYIITDRRTGDKFQFASRSVALPPGFGFSGVLA